jgi:Ni,Fe-hydrogenase III large subunit
MAVVVMSGMTPATALHLPVNKLHVELVEPARWRERISSMQDARFLCLYAREADAVRISALFERGVQIHALETTVQDGSLPTIVDLVPAANWDEREAHDLYDVAFSGHEPLRPLVDHSGDLDAWTVAVHGHGPHQVAVGPIHAGITESAHFRLHQVGERILQVDLRLFYKHRGLERVAEQMPLEQALAVVQRACAGCAVTNTVAFAQACEQALGVWPDDRLAANRTVLLELERVWNHLNDISAICAGVGFAPGTMAFAALKERAQRLNDEVAGHRFLFGTVAVGGAPIPISQSQARDLRASLREIRSAAAKAWREVLFNNSVQARLHGVGVLTEAQALELGTVGPAARASGIARDARTSSPRLAYGSSFAPAALPDPTGDVRARLELRPVELEASFVVLDELLTRRLEDAGSHPVRDRSDFGASVVESPRGATVCVVHLDDEQRVARLHLRTGSYANWRSVALSARDNLLPDFPLINKSFELCYACADR